MPCNVLPLHLKQTFSSIIWIITEGEGDEIKSRLPFKIFSNLVQPIMNWHLPKGAPPPLDVAVDVGTWSRDSFQPTTSFVSRASINCLVRSSRASVSALLLLSSPNFFPQGF